jgi:aryl-alcohol dehydrogenase-like predicted oxidoreductase
LSECSAKTLGKANDIAKIDAVEAEYSAFETVHETDGLIEACRDLGVAFVAYSPLGHGWLVDDFPYKSPDDFAADDLRRTCKFSSIDSSVLPCFQRTDLWCRFTAPKFLGENFYKNKAIVEEIKKLANKKGCGITQIALAWVAAQGFIAIAGTTKPHRLEENFASRDISLNKEELAEMREILESAKTHGDRYNEAGKKTAGN